MRTRICVFAAVLCVVEFCVLGCRSSAGAGGARPGTVNSDAPSFSLQDINGHPLDLATYRGKVVLLNFWATWCTPCRGEIPSFVQWQDSYGPQGLQIIGISMDDGPQPVREFYGKFKMNYPVAVGTDKLAQSYGGVLGLPVSFLIGRDGKVVAKYVGAVDIPTVEQTIKSQLQAK
jgi:thiol-disulfide isomerase/thioredoxin